MKEPLVKQLALFQARGLGLAIWRSEAKYEDMMYISYRVTGGVKGLYTALNNDNGHDCRGSDCGGDLVRGHVHMTSAKFSDFGLPPPLSEFCSDLQYRIHATSLLAQPPLSVDCGRHTHITPKSEEEASFSAL